MIIKLPKMPSLGPELYRLNVTLGMFAVSFFGIQQLIKVLYILRLGYGLEYVGLFSSVSAFAYMAMSLPSGVLGARFGSQKVMVAGGIITVIGMIALPLVEFVPLWARDAWPIVGQFVGTGGWALFSVNLVPTLMATTSPQNRSSAYAWNSVFRGLGTFLGTIIGGLLPGLFVVLLGQSLDDPAPYRYSLWVGVAVSLTALIPLSRITVVPQVEAKETTKADEAFPVLTTAMMVIYVFLSQGGRATCQAFCNAYMDTDLGLSAAAIGTLTGLGQFAAVLVPLFGPRLAARYSTGWTLMVATAGGAVSLLPLALIPHWSTAGLGRLGMLALWALWLPALQLFQMELVGSRWRSVAYSIIAMAMSLSYGSISLIGGYIAAAWGYQALFLVGIGLSLVGAALMWGLLKTPILHPPVVELSSQQSL